MKNNGNLLFATAAILFGSNFLIGPLAAQSAPGDPASRDGTIPEKQISKPLESSQGISSPGLETGRSESLSDKLDQSNGVITPPRGVDPGITKRAPVPNPNSTPVIKPAPSIESK